MPWWIAAVATVALILLSAKAHGRQIRLEREQQGYFRVEFRAQNPAAVEAIWRADRRIFWPTFAALAFLVLAIAGLAWVTIRFPFSLPVLAVQLGEAFAGGFVVAGLAGWVRLSGRDQGPLPWRRRAQRGSVGWWLAVAAAAALANWALLAN